MLNENIEHLISTLILSSSNDILSKVSLFFIEIENDDINIIISKYFQSLFNLEQWTWEILSRDCREWNENTENEYIKLFSKIYLFNQKLILSNNDIKTKESLLIPTNIDIINRIFQQINQRHNETDHFLFIINLWFDNLSLFINENKEIIKYPLIIHINQQMISNIFLTKQFEDYFHQLKISSSITIKQMFYLKTSILFLNRYLSSKPQEYLINPQEILEYLSQDYTTIILLYSQTISSWNEDFLSCFTHLIGLITTCQYLIGINYEILQMFIISKKSFYDYIESLINILNYQPYYQEIHIGFFNNKSIVFNNILRLFLYLINYQEIKHYFKSQQRLFDIFLIFNQMINNQLSLVTYCLQVEILSEKEFKQLDIANDISENFFEYLQEAWKNSLRKYNHITIEELLDYLLNLSKNEIMKDAIIKSNQLKFLIELSEEYFIVYEIIWSLSFDIRIQKQLRSNQLFQNTLKNICIDKQIIQGIKWNLNMNIRTNLIKPIQEKLDIFISYSPEDKLISTNISNELIKNDHHVWIDTNNDNNLENIIDIIEQSHIMIVCMSEKYEKNHFCRIQAEYAFKKQIKILPILIEKYYQIDSWLLFLAGNIFSIDFTKNSFIQSINLLLNELKTPHISVLDSLVIRQQPQNLINSSSLTTKSIQQWTKDDVQQWLNENNLQHTSYLLSDLNGLSLISLSELISNNSPQENLILFQQDSLNRTGKNISLIEITKLHQLIQQQIHKPTKAKKIKCNNYCCYMM